MEGYFDLIHSNRLPGLKHKELRSSKTARQWKNPLLLGESPPLTVLSELVGAGLEISPTPTVPVNIYYERKKGAKMSLSGYETIINQNIE